MLLDDIVKASTKVVATPSRKGKVAAIAAVLRLTPPENVQTAICYLSGDLPQRRTGVGWASLRALPEPSAGPTLELGEVNRAFDTIEQASGPGSVAKRAQEVTHLFSRATAAEQSFLSALIGGELRQGALAGIMADAIAAASEVDVSVIRKAAMVVGNLPRVGQAALAGGVAALAEFHLQVGVPIQPMLAQSASSVEEAIERTGASSIEWKLDGIRVQVHRHEDEVEVFTRTLDRITERVPEIVEEVLTVPVRSIILDGETISLRSDGRPRPFQETGSRVASKVNVHELRKRLPLTTFFFDVLHLDGEDLIDQPLRHRVELLRSTVAERYLVPHLSTDDPWRGQQFSEDTIAHGHEGVVVKSLDSIYEAGRRGVGWVKVKPHHTLDLAILAAEWGHGRRTGFLSNLHLGALDPRTGQYVMLGKTFKGLTDEMLRFQTKRLQELETRRDSYAVYVRPELLVEIAFDGLQTSTRYPAGMALRFARVVRFREDKPASEADTIDTVRGLHARNS